METTIPFNGFYASTHEAAIDFAIESACQNDDGELNEELRDKIYQVADFKKIHEEYAKAYLDAFSKEIEINLEFKELSSPKYYNFETDRIFTEISNESVLKMWSNVNRNDLQKLIQKRFTSCSGFISFYKNDLDRWPENVLEWDLNQVGTLLEVYAETVHNWDNEKEVYLLDNTDFLYPLIAY